MTYQKYSEKNQRHVVYSPVKLTVVKSMQQLLLSMLYRVTIRWYFNALNSSSPYCIRQLLKIFQKGFFGAQKDSFMFQITKEEGLFQNIKL